MKKLFHFELSDLELKHSLTLLVAILIVDVVLLTVLCLKLFAPADNAQLRYDYAEKDIKTEKPEKVYGAQESGYRKSESLSAETVEDADTMLSQETNASVDR